MKKLLLFGLLICSACVYSAQQSDANHAAEQYIRENLDPKGLQSIAFSPLEVHRYATALDSSLNYAHVSSDDKKKMEKYVDSENYQRPDLQPGNERDLYNIEHHKLTYYTLDYSFRIDSQGHKKLKRYHFELDTVFNVIKATDITYGRDTQTEH
ncbi:MAG: hypothetical protein JST19_01250 [Bacteroidetes bacterium]|nr:hypothetical protein [Bacteroidota bacterium]